MGVGVVLEGGAPDFPVGVGQKRIYISLSYVNVVAV